MSEEFSKRTHRSYYNEHWRKEVPREQPSDIVAEAVKHVLPGETLDLGAGDGRNAVFLARNGFAVTAIDFSETAVRVITERATKEHLPIHAELADIKHWAPTPEQQYRVIVCTHLLQLFPAADARALLGRIQNATEPGGWNVIDAWINEGDQYRLNKTTGNFYVARGQMRELYARWNIAFYNEAETTLYKRDSDGKQLRNMTARLIARKPETRTSAE
jgi:tellurite methyltransferase